jgi:hypothetical protein
LTIVDQALERVTATGTEDKERAGEWITGKCGPAYRGQTVYPLAEVYRLDRHQDPHLWRDLDHDCLQNASTNLRTAVVSLGKCTVIVAPWPLRSSTLQAAGSTLTEGNGISTKPGGQAGEPFATAPSSESVLSRCSLW